MSLWHNSFDDIAGGGSDELSSVDYDEFGAASHHDDPLRAVGQLEDAQRFIDASSVLASVPQGRRLRDDAIRLGSENNLEVGGGLIVASAESRRVDMGNGLKFTVVAPMRDELEEYERAHHGNPYMTLAKAKEMQRVALQFWYLRAAQKKADRQTQVPRTSSLSKSRRRCS